MPYAATCKKCGKAFLPSRHSAGLYCSRTCSDKRNELPSKTLKCPTCGKDFEWRKGKREKYCSLKCAGAGVGSDGTARMTGGRVTTICGVCGKEFSDWRAKNRKYCSADCSSIAVGRGKSEYASKDANHNEIKAALIAHGATVYDLHAVGNGAPDMLVGWQGENFLMEIKNMKSLYGRKGLNKKQRLFAGTWRGGHVHVVYSKEQAIEIMAKHVAELTGRPVVSDRWALDNIS